MGNCLRARFETYCHTMFRAALERNPDLFPEHARQRMLSPPTIDGKLNELFVYAAGRSIPLYVLIDEYDNFANTILSERGNEAYQSFTHHGGFYRNFFATLKAGAGFGGGIERLFITGVSPLTMDVTSGFNIGTTSACTESSTSCSASRPRRYAAFRRATATRSVRSGRG